MGLSETAGSLGAMLGPMFGSLLFSLGGYTTPFFFFGGLSLLMAIVIFFIFKFGARKKVLVEDSVE